MTNSPERILAIKLAGLGDLLLCEPALRSLRCSFPKARIDVLTTPESGDLLSCLDGAYQPILFPKELFDQISLRLLRRGTPRLFNLFTTIRRASYDLVVLFHHLTTSAGVAKYRALLLAAGAVRTVGLDNGRGGFLTDSVIDAGFGEHHETDYMLAVAKKAGGVEVDPNPLITAKSDQCHYSIPEPFVAMYPVTGTYSNARNWEISNFIRLGNLLTEQGLNIVLVGGEDAQDAATTIRQSLPNAIDLAGKTSISELANILQHATVSVGADTFAGHLAAAVGSPVVSIFGPSDSHAWRPYGTEFFKAEHPGCRRGFIVTANLPCSPCLYSGYHLGRPAGCPDKTCMRSVLVEKVFAAVMTVTESQQ